MKGLNSHFATFCLIALFTFTSNGQTNPSSPAAAGPTNASLLASSSAPVGPMQLPPRTESPTNTPNLEQELLKQQNQFLKEELELTKEGNAKLLANIHWTLGTVGAMALLLVGYNWYATFKQFKDEKVGLKQEIVDGFKREQTTLENNLKGEINLLNERQNAFNSLITVQLNDSQRKLDERMAKIEQRWQEKLDGLEGRIDGRIAAAFGAAETNAKSLVEAKSSQLSNEIAEQNRNLTTEIEKVNKTTWLNKAQVCLHMGVAAHADGNESRAFSQYLAAIDAATMCGDEIYETVSISRVSDMIAKGFKPVGVHRAQILRMASSISAGSKAEFQAIIDALPPEDDKI